MKSKGWFGVLLVSLTVGLRAQDDSGMFIVHTFQDGDTMSALAERYFGDGRAAAEILQFNSIANPLAVKPGQEVVIPVGLRQRALDQIDRATDGVKAARAAQADELAPQAFESASKMLSNAMRLRQQASYDQAIAFATLAERQATHAVAEADLRAVVQDPATVVATSGNVEISTTAGEGWRAAVAGEKLPAGGRVRTGPGSRGEIRLADGSRLQLQESSEFVLEGQQRDQRSQRRDTQLRLLIGDMIGDIEPVETPDSQLEIQSHGSVTAIRGTTLRIGADDEKTIRVSVLKGAVELAAAGEEALIPELFGSLARHNQPPLAPVQLPAAPRLVEPRAEVQTAVQRVRFEWAAGESGAPAANYILEIATDERFNRLVQKHVLSQTAWASEPLAPGTYYWRVAGVDRHGLVGPATPAARLTVKRDLALRIVSSPAPVKIGGRNVVGPRHRFNAVPRSADTSIVRMEYRWGDSEFQSLDGPVALETDGEHVLQVRGIGADGVAGPTLELALVGDVTPPEVRSSLRRERRSAEDYGRVWVTLTAEDESGVERIEYSLNQQPFTVYEAPLDLSPLVDQHLRFRASDRLGNLSETWTLHLPGERVRR